MDELLALHFSDATYFGVHRLFVDTYCLQHPDRYCVSFKSLAAHLAHVCWSLEHQGSRAIPSEAIRHWVELPTAVAGITLPSLYAPNGWLGRPLDAIGVKVAFAPLGITIALIFIGLPFVVRSLQPVIEGLDIELEEAATSLRADRLKVVRRVILPYLYPAWLTGFALAFARAIGAQVRLIGLLQGGMALLACYIPARRATAVDPVVALRCE